MDFDLSITMSRGEMKGLREEATTGESIRSFYNLTRSDDTPMASMNGREKSHLLFQQFLEILQSRTSDTEIFDTIQDIIQTCTDAIEEMSKFRRGGIDIGAQRDLVWLTQERNTWRLLYCLYKDRLIVQKEAADYDDLPLVGSEKLIVEHLYTNNANLREYQLIVDWLELCALENGDLQMGHYTDRTVCWENTLHQLQNLDQTVFGGSKEIVKSLDPDAPIREKRPLHDLDAEDEIRLSKQVCIRSAFY